MRLALHPDDPPLPSLGGVGRIMTSLESIKRAVTVVDSPMLGVTFCQACYPLMGDELENAIKTLAEKIFFVHFRNVRGSRTDFRESVGVDGYASLGRLFAIGYYSSPEAFAEADAIAAAGINEGDSRAASTDARDA